MEFRGSLPVFWCFESAQPNNSWGNRRRLLFLTTAADGEQKWWNASFSLRATILFFSAELEHLCIAAQESLHGGGKNA